MVTAFARKLQRLYGEDYFSRIGKKGGKIGGKINGKHVQAIWRKRNPESFVQHQSNAGRIGGSVTGPKNITKALRWQLDNPDKHREFSRKAGRISGRIAVETGQIFEAMNASLGSRRVYHIGHWHLSSAEKQYCIDSVWSNYSHNLIHVNVYFKWGTPSACIIDWVIAKPGVRFSSKNPATWSRVIEHHKVRLWLDETSKSYKQIRISKLRKLGVTCPIEVICY